MRILLLAAMWIFTLASTASADSFRIANCNVTDHKNGVYYFYCTRSDFGDALSVYRSDTKRPAIISVAPDDSSMYGKTRGYFVMVEHKAERK